MTYDGTPVVPTDESGASAGCAVGGASDDRAPIESAAARAGVVRDGHGWSHVPKGDWLAVWFDYGDWRTGSAGRVIPHHTELDALLALPPAPGIAEAEQRAGLTFDADTATWRRANGDPVVWYLPGEGPWLVDTGERLIRRPTLLEALREAPSADAVAFVARFADRCQDAPEPAPERVVSPAPSPLAAGGESSASGVGLSPAPTLVERIAERCHLVRGHGAGLPDWRPGPNERWVVYLTSYREAWIALTGTGPGWTSHAGSGPEAEEAALRAYAAAKGIDLSDLTTSAPSPSSAPRALAPASGADLHGASTRADRAARRAFEAARTCGQPDHLFGPCVLAAGHGYWHQDAEGNEWGATPKAVARG